MDTLINENAADRLQKATRFERRLRALIGCLQSVMLALVGCAICVAEEPVAWHFDQGDCGLSVIEQTLQPSADSTPAATRAHLTAKLGSRAYATCEAPDQMPVISELTVSLDLKANRAGLQLFVRAVLPRSATDGGSRTVLIGGPKYSTQGQWQTLTLSNLPQLLEKEARLARVASPSPIDVREAYIDMVGVNVYGGVGATTVWLAAPRLEGAARCRSPTELALSSIDHLPAIKNHKVRSVGSAITIDGRPIAIRAIKPRGESWEFLKGLGFNTICLRTVPSAEEMATAEKLSLWLVGRVPSLQNLSLLDSHLYRRVVAWDLRTGNGTRAEQKMLAESIRLACGSEVKPLLCTDLSHPSLGSRFADIVLHRGSGLGTTEAPQISAHLLTQEVERSLPTAIHWSTLQTHLSARVIRQARGMSRHVAIEDAAFPPDQLSLATANSFAAGVRTFLVDDEHRLDGTDLQSKIRAASLRRLNRMQSIVAPWLLSDRLATIQNCDHPHLSLATLETDRSVLAIPIYQPPHQQLCAAIPPSGPISMSLRHPSAAAGVYLIRDAGLKRISSQRVAGGIQFEIDDLSSVWAILVTADERIAARIAGKLRRSISMGTSEQQSAQLLRNRGRSAGAGGYTGLDTSQQRSEWDRERSNLPPATCPLLAHGNWSSAFATWRAGSPMAARGVNLLVGSDFENLDRLLASGWSAGQLDQPGMTAQISLSDQGRSGRCLRIAADQPGSRSMRSRRPLAWVSSAPMDIAEGQSVRIDGWIRVRSSLASQQPVATIFDSWAGSNLAWHEAATSDWKSFTLYRVCTGEPLVVTCGLTALGELLVDNLQISPMADTTVARR